MDWDKLKIFHAVAEAGSFTNATINLNLSQIFGSIPEEIEKPLTDAIYSKVSTLIQKNKRENKKWSLWSHGDLTIGERDSIGLNPREIKTSGLTTARGAAFHDAALDSVKKELDDIWFDALQKQGLGSEELIDTNIHVGTRIDAAGDEVDIVQPMREFMENDAKAAQALERLKDCK